MNEVHDVTAAIYDGWHTYQRLLVEAIAPLQEDQLELRAAPHLRSVRENVLHMIGARARWFSGMGEGGEQFAALGEWDRPGEPSRSAPELVEALEETWRGMHEAIARWSEAAWQETWPNEYDDEPDVFTRQWIIWHLIEHDVHHGGEISLTLGVHGIEALAL